MPALDFWKTRVDAGNTERAASAEGVNQASTTLTQSKINAQQTGVLAAGQALGQGIASAGKSIGEGLDTTAATEKAYRLLHMQNQMRDEGERQAAVGAAQSAQNTTLGSFAKGSDAEATFENDLRSALPPAIVEGMTPQEKAYFRSAADSVSATPVKRQGNPALVKQAGARGLDEGLVGMSAERGTLERDSQVRDAIRKAAANPITQQRVGSKAKTFEAAARARDRGNFAEAYELEHGDERLHGPTGAVIDIAKSSSAAYPLGGKVQSIQDFVMKSGQMDDRTLAKIVRGGTVRVMTAAINEKGQVDNSGAELKKTAGTNSVAIRALQAKAGLGVVEQGNQLITVEAARQSVREMRDAVAASNDPQAKALVAKFSDADGTDDLVELLATRHYGMDIEPDRSKANSIFADKNRGLLDLFSKNATTAPFLGYVDPTADPNWRQVYETSTREVQYDDGNPLRQLASLPDADIAMSLRNARNALRSDPGITDAARMLSQQGYGAEEARQIATDNLASITNVRDHLISEWNARYPDQPFDGMSQTARDSILREATAKAMERVPRKIQTIELTGPESRPESRPVSRAETQKSVEQSINPELLEGIPPNQQVQIKRKDGSTAYMLNGKITAVTKGKGDTLSSVPFKEDSPSWQEDAQAAELGHKVATDDGRLSGMKRATLAAQFMLGGSGVPQIDDMLLAKGEDGVTPYEKLSHLLSQPQPNHKETGFQVRKLLSGYAHKTGVSFDNLVSHLQDAAQISDDPVVDGLAITAEKMHGLIDDTVHDVQMSENTVDRGALKDLESLDPEPAEPQGAPGVPITEDDVLRSLGIETRAQGQSFSDKTSDAASSNVRDLMERVRNRLRPVIGSVATDMIPSMDVGEAVRPFANAIEGAGRQVKGLAKRLSDSQGKPKSTISGLGRELIESRGEGADRRY